MTLASKRLARVKKRREAEVQAMSDETVPQDSDSMYAGIADACNNSEWSNNVGSSELTIDSLVKLHSGIIAQGKREDEIRFEWGRKYRESSPEQKRRFDSEYRAHQEILGCDPDPVHPAIVHPKIAERLMARAEEIFNAGTDCDDAE